ncbi:cytochrome c family protein [Roseibacterium sp. SDUM158017]|uniref:c-type cytochrome n=1 Tax=Roseicyclus salinarum TaxID=3036773 RepID=UPI002414D08C|nr:cytochrome c family protein [Roseibacterium sp. SDUM158017]MDG4647117.1 cytochrome c family protein [Roseibacterium sp. SDUM158017]
MLDTMTVTKAFGALCGALLVFLLGGWAAESLYHVDRPEDQARGYVIIDENAPADDAPEEEVVEVAFADVYASADPAAGERLWRQCQACHALQQGQNGVGPYLYGVVGRDKAAVDGFSYSDALSSMEGDWTPENLSGFIENPREYAPGTAMSYAGMRDVEDRANLIAYLATIGE